MLYLITKLYVCKYACVSSCRTYDFAPQIVIYYDNRTGLAYAKTRPAQDADQGLHREETKRETKIPRRIRSLSLNPRICCLPKHNKIVVNGFLFQSRTVKKAEKQNFYIRRPLITKGVLFL